MNRPKNYKHGFWNHPVYHVYRAMRNRCENPKNKSYSIYGGRGIRVCERWLEFENFKDDMLSSYIQGLTLERGDSNLDYSPENCTWATRVEQARNRRNSKYIEMDGEKKLVVEWCEQFGIRYGLYQYRVSSMGWSAEKALKTPKLTVWNKTKNSKNYV